MGFGWARLLLSAASSAAAILYARSTWAMLGCFPNELLISCESLGGLSDDCQGPEWFTPWAARDVRNRTGTEPETDCGSGCWPELAGRAEADLPGMPS